MYFPKNSSILITGGTGSIGNSLVKNLINDSNVRKIIVFSRDELKQYNMKSAVENNEKLRWFLGDIRDLSRLHRALNGVDYVIHAAALKQVDAGEYNPIEFIKTNIEGSKNVIEASIDKGIKKVIALSTDKASSPINLYGATKLTADKLFISANNYSANRETIFSIVRYGNVLGSRGSVIPLWKNLAKQGESLPITDSRMTRFAITINQATKFILESFARMKGGELYIPIIPSFKLMDLVKAIDQEAKVKEIGLRAGEKLHEEMISEDDSRRTVIQEGRYVVNPTQEDWGYILPVGEKYPEGQAYRSDNNKIWLTVDEIRNVIENES
jgi:UDP-N-acetylglucosamine 4,6-dehydratase